MKSFELLSANVRGFVQLWALMIVFLFVYELVRYIQINRSLLRMALCAEEVCGSVFYQQLLMRINEGKPSVQWISVVLLLAAFSVLAGAELVSIGVWRSKNLSPMSLKDSVDHLPTGICFYWEGGLPKLINRRMDSICRQITGEALLDAAAFWESLEKGGVEGSVRSGSEPIVCLKDNIAYAFARHENYLEGRRIYEIIASDISEEYRLTLELSKKQKQANYINSRLKALNSSVQYLIMDKEILGMKVHIHDSLGKTLLMTREYMTKPDTINKDELLSLWRTNIMLLKNEESEKWQQPYFINSYHAAKLGVRLIISGELPKQELLIPLIESALSVHVTNVLRHAEGNEAYISVSQEDGSFLLTFTNNGSPPDTKVKETGGLANLRKLIEKYGGEMDIESEPQFKMILKLPPEPKESVGYGI